jgi:hypothetical protein
MKDENGDLLVDYHNILNRWKSYFSQLLNVHSVNDIRQIEIHTAQPLVPASSLLVVEIATTKLKKYNSPGSAQILAEVIQKGGILSMIHKEELPISGKTLLLYKFIKRGIMLTLLIIVGYRCYQVHTKFF